MQSSAKNEDEAALTSVETAPAVLGAVASPP